jgi:ABC-2 type transport system permease protein
MDVIYYLVNILFFKVIYLHTGMLADWTQEQIMIFVSAYLLVDALNMTIFSSNMWWIPFFINRGDLDYYLIRPVSPLFFLSLKEFSANSFLNLLMAVSFFAYNLFHYSASFSVLDLLLFVALIINGALIYYCIQMLMIIPVFWTHSSRGFVDLFYAMGIAMERPDRIYKGWIRKIFTIFLPFALIASFPTRIFLENFNLNLLLHLIGVTVGLWITMLGFWKLGLKNYSSASS